MEKMERYRPNLFNRASPPRTKKPSFVLNTPSQISLLPKPHLQDPPISLCLEPVGERVVHPAYDSEISIFDAERYFNEDQDSTDISKKLTVTVIPVTERHDLSLHPPESAVPSLKGFGRNSKNISFHAAPTVSSEASWNSQTGLLKNPPGSLSVSVRKYAPSEQKKGSSSPARCFFRRTCPCSGRMSIDVEEDYSVTKSPIRPSLDSTLKSKSLKTEQDVAQVTTAKVFPRIWPKESGANRYPPEKLGIIHCSVNSTGVSFPAPLQDKLAVDPARHSLEVFRPSDGSTSPILRKSMDYSKIPMFLLSGEERRSFNFTGSPKRRSIADDDLASDTSSDLFEIESFSTQMASRRRESINEHYVLPLEAKKTIGNAAGQLRRSIEVEASECYAPSEVSVEWSVTTAEGFDRTSMANFSSAVSEFDELRYAADALAGERKKKGIGGAVGLLSCRSQKAVSVVAPNVMRFGSVAQRRSGASGFSFEPDHAVNPVRDGARTSRTVQRINARIY